MMPRLFDERVGYFTNSMTDYGTTEHKSVTRTYIARYRLEKKDPNAAISEPVKPITFSLAGVQMKFSMREDRRRLTAPGVDGGGGLLAGAQ